MSSFYYTFSIQIVLFMTRIPGILDKSHFVMAVKLFIVNDGDCFGGLQFGKRKPSCIWVSGVHRSWTKDCKGFDGFTQDYCFPPIDIHDDTKSIQGI